MEAQKRVLRSRKPLSDCTDIDSLTQSPSRSSSSSAFKKCKSATTAPSLVTWDRHVTEPISVVYSRRRTSEKRKNKEKAVAIPFSSTLIGMIFGNEEESNEFEVVDLPECTTVPYRKKQRAVSSEDVPNHALLEDINKQKAYFNEIDEYKLPVEEVDTVEELE